MVLLIINSASLLMAHPTSEMVYEHDHNKGHHLVDFTKGSGVEPWLDDLAVESRPQPSQGLGGRRVFLAAGHGRTFNESSFVWGWQRDVVDGGEVEDLITPRVVNRWIAEYFENAGANIVIARERDEQLNEFHLDDADPSTTFSGTWSEINSVDGTYYEGTAQRVAADSGAEITWFANIPELDEYGLRIWFPAEIDATTSATLIIHTAAGDVTAKINQQRNGSRWLWIDQFVFPEGNVPIATLVADQNAAGSFLYADAIRLGGGMGDYNLGGGVSGLPRWQEFTKSWAMKYGAPPSVWDSFVQASDFGIRRDFGFWAGGDIYIEIHSNADGLGNGTQTGTLTFWSRSTDSTMRNLFEQNHDGIITDLRTRWMPSWRDDGFTNDTVNGTVLPSYLLEMAYHDRVTPDLESLLDPDFRRIIARSIYEGAVPIVRGDDNGVFLPEPPEDFAVINSLNNSALLSWKAPSYGPQPDSYMVYESRDGLSFDLGTDVGNVSSVTLDGYNPGDVIYYQVRAINEGGRSFPTKTMVVRIGSDFENSILLVNGFSRMDRFVQEKNNPPNLLNYYVDAFVEADPDIAIASALDTSFDNPELSLIESYNIVWILGLESVEDETLSSEAEDFIETYLNNNSQVGFPIRGLFICGTDIAEDLIVNGNLSAICEQPGIRNPQCFPQFFLNLEDSLGRTTAKTATGTSGSFFDGMSFSLTGINDEPYEVQSADILQPTPLADPVITWPNGQPAAIYFHGINSFEFFSRRSKTIVSSIPLEAVKDMDERNAYAAGILDFLSSPVEEDTTGPQIISTNLGPISQTTAGLAVDTNEATELVLRYGEDENNLNESVSSLNLLRNHSVTMDGLEAETQYFYQIEVTDLSNNLTESSISSFVSAAPDTIPPSIGSIRTIVVSDRDAVIEFQTNENALAAVEPAFPHSWRENTGEYNLLHYLYLFNLPASSSITVPVSAADVQDNKSQQNFSFNTLPAVPDLIVDNLDPEFSITQGNWGSGSFGNPFNGSYVFASTNGTTITSSVIWEAELPLEGFYRVSTRYTSGGNRAPDAPYSVFTDDGSETFFINQQSNGDTWITLENEGPFFDQLEASVTLNNMTNQSGSFVVIGDAVRWEYLGLLNVIIPEVDIDAEDQWWLY